MLNGVFIYSGIDRVDSAKSYNAENCVPCCKVCNYMKRSLSRSEFLSHIAMINAHANQSTVKLESD